MILPFLLTVRTGGGAGDIPGLLGDLLLLPGLLGGPAHPHSHLHLRQRGLQLQLPHLRVQACHVSSAFHLQPSCLCLKAEVCAVFTFADCAKVNLV